MNIEANDLRALVEGVWVTVVGLPVRPGGPEAAAADGAGDFLTGCVAITGGWEGAVTLECSVALARQATGVLFDEDPARVTAEQVHDALAELTNIVGGNLKALLPGPTSLSLPAVAAGSHDALQVLDSQSLCRVAFRCRDWPFRVSVLASTLAADKPV